MFREEYEINQHRAIISAAVGYVSIMISKDSLASHLDERIQYGSGASIAKLLQAGHKSLDDIQYSNISVDREAKLITLTETQLTPPTISLSMNNPTDFAFFKSLRKLNVGKIQERIEENQELSDFIQDITGLGI